MHMQVLQVRVCPASAVCMTHLEHGWVAHIGCGLEGALSQVQALPCLQCMAGDLVMSPRYAWCTQHLPQAAIARRRAALPACPTRSRMPCTDIVKLAFNPFGCHGLPSPSGANLPAPAALLAARRSAASATSGCRLGTHHRRPSFESLTVTQDLGRRRSHRCCSEIKLSIESQLSCKVSLVRDPAGSASDLGRSKGMAAAEGLAPLPKLGSLVAGENAGAAGGGRGGASAQAGAGRPPANKQPATGQFAGVESSSCAISMR